MKIDLLISKDLSTVKTKCLVVVISTNKKLSANASSLDKKMNNQISESIKNGVITGEIGSSLLLTNIKTIKAENILLLGCGKDKELSEKDFKKIIQTGLINLSSTLISQAVFAVDDLKLINRDIYWNIRFATQVISEHFYKFNQFKKRQDKPARLDQVSLLVDNKQSKVAKSSLEQAMVIAQSVSEVKDLANMPPNICNPKYLADVATKLSKENKQVKLKIVDEQEMKKLGMNAYLAVSSGSVNQAYMSVLTYNNHPNKKAAPIVLVGKGITFDSGGISIKPSSDMDEMKYDMSGAATVYGVIKAAAKLKLPLNIIGVMAACENLPDGNAYRPGDIITSMKGLSIEILSTDAEGRMVLSDALTYVEMFKPEVVIDIATLTGACMVALGHHNTGLMTKDDELANELLKAAKDSHDATWRLPLEDEYDQLNKSNFADLANTGGRYAGATTAGCFLSNFTDQYRWAHLDIAGTAWQSGANKGATGRPVQLLMQYLLNKVK